MSTIESPEYIKLTESLVWSAKKFNLTEFVRKYPLPQVVSVEVGYCGDDDRTTFGKGQILTLHTIHKASKIVCQPTHGNAVLVDTSCPLKAEVISMDCHETVVNAYKLSTTYKKVKYIRVLDIGSSLTVKNNDVLHIKKTDRRMLQCRNLTAEQDVSISTESTSLFVPLADPHKYTLTEIQRKFKLPAKIRFTNKTEEIILRNKPGRRLPPKESPLLCGMNEMTAIEEIKNSDIIVTTVCQNPKENICLPVPTSLELQVTVAEGFLKGDDTYQKVVMTLDKQYNRTNLKDFDDFGIYGHVALMKETMNELNTKVVVDRASAEITKHARGQLQRMQRQKFKKLFPLERQPQWQHKRQNSTQESKKQSDDPSNKDGYETPLEYASITEISEKPAYEENDRYTVVNSNYTELDRNYTRASTEVYQALLKDPAGEQDKQSTSKPPPLPSSKPPPLPSSPPLQTEEDKNAIYEAISRYSKDLTGLSVADVSKLLKYLGMKNYVDTFEKELIDGAMLTTLDEESLQSLGVQAFHSKKLMKFIRGWRPYV